MEILGGRHLSTSLPVSVIYVRGGCKGARYDIRHAPLQNGAMEHTALAWKAHRNGIM